jgi:hypothetical protein
MRLRQVALVAAALEPVLADLRAVLDLDEPFRDPGVGMFGLSNGVFAVGQDFLEVVCPDHPDSAGARFLERRGGDGGYMVILQSPDLSRDRVRLEGLGVRIVWEIALDDIATIHLHPRDVGGAIVSIDEPVPPASWRWGGPDWNRREASAVVAGLAGVELAAADPGALAGRWAEVLGLAAEHTGRGWRLALEDGAALLFRRTAPCEAEGLVAVDFRTLDASRALEAARQRGLVCEERSVIVAGTRLRFGA